MFRRLGLAAAVSLVLLAGGTVIAQTPDGETPAEESICTALLAEGITPGLYGLCVAYCEAHDAEVDTLTAICNPPDVRLLENYIRKMQKTDPPMPCLRPDCPCWDFDDVLKLAVFDPKTDCWAYTCSDVAKYDDAGLIGLDTGVTGRGIGEARVMWARKPGEGICLYARGGKPVVHSVTSAQAEVCRNLILDAFPMCMQ